MESNALRYFLNLSRACLFDLNFYKYIFLANVKALSHQKWNEYASG